MKRHVLTLLLLCSLAMAGGVSTGQAAEQRLTQVDQDFLSAREAFQKGDLARLERLYPRFAGYLLEPYATYYLLHMRLEKVDPARIQQYLARPPDTPMIDRLRQEWLKQLGKKQRWDAFAEEYPHLVNEDAELLCDALQARFRVQHKETLIEARRLWKTGEAQPGDCMPIFDIAMAEGFVNERDVWERIRMALEAGDVAEVRLMAAKLPGGRSFPVSKLDRAYGNPGRYLDKAKLEQAGPGERLLALFALRRLARQSPQIALVRWEKILAYFPEAEQRYFYGWLGYEAARKLDDRALGWYLQAGNSPLISVQRAWRTRAALRHGNWREVLASINAMGAEQQQRSAWRYWKARALDNLGIHVQAQALFTALSGEYGYYGQLAVSELDVATAPLADRHIPAPEEVDRVLAETGIQRALLLYRLGLNVEAVREWNWATRAYNDRQLLAAAEAAHRYGFYERSIGTAVRTRQLHDFNLRFPAPFRDELREHVRGNELEEAWVYGLMRQESRFAMQANSVVGAAGLMQIMPSTARWVARKIGMKHYRNAQIRELGTNLKLGTYYLKTVYSQLGDNPVLASAAYNAGPNRARQWLGDRVLEGAIFIENIPFDETRNYVKKVMSNTVYYSRLFGQPRVPLKQRLGLISPQGYVSVSPASNER